ncbi:MAG: sulfatase family protein [Lentimonas sp.]
MHRHLLQYIRLIWLLGIVQLVVSPLSAKPFVDRPNIVLVFADDLGYGDLSCYGATKINTPHVDKLATEGKRFTDAHSASSVCTPSRYALMTGEYPHRKSLYSPVFLKTPLVIDTEQQTIANVLKDAGYVTACVGKWHLGFGGKAKGPTDWNAPLKPGPLELGFDYFFGLPVVNSHPPFVYVENHEVLGADPKDPFVYGETAKTKEIHEKMHLDEIGGADAAHALYEDAYVATKLTEKATDWIKQQGESPFFLYLATTNIHHPFTPHPQFVGTSEAGLYGDFVHELDWMVGEIMKTLEAQGVADNTLIIFTSDNGGMINETAQEAVKLGHEINGELLGAKFDAWEGGHRVPFIAWWPGQIEAASVSNEVICNIDMIRSFAELTGATLKPGQGQDSESFLSVLTNESAAMERDHLLISPFRSAHLSVRQGKWMYISGPAGGGFSNPRLGTHGFGGPAAVAFMEKENSNMQNGRLKPDIPPGQLYDMEQDPYQTANVYEDYPEVVTEMSALLKSYPSKSKKKKYGISH